jgi:ATP-dependent DNA ligase
MEEAEGLAKQFIKEGFEGAILRKDNAGYEYGYSNHHSSNLIKIKPKFDSEFPVVGYTQGTKGKDVGAVIWECSVPKPLNAKDDRFTVVPRGMTQDDRKKIFRCLGQKVINDEGKTVTRFERDVKGLPLTVEYAGLSTKTGKPLQAKAVAFRTYEGTANTAGHAVEDPIQKLFRECL